MIMMKMTPSPRMICRVVCANAQVGLHRACCHHYQAPSIRTTTTTAATTGSTTTPAYCHQSTVDIEPFGCSGSAHDTAGYRRLGQQSDPPSAKPNTSRTRPLSQRASCYYLCRFYRITSHCRIRRPSTSIHEAVELALKVTVQWSTSIIQ